MDLTIVKEIPDGVIKALCNTLIHSLWQGLILAAVAGLIIVFTSKTAPAKRYNLLIAALILFICTVAYTFTYQLHEANVYDAIVASNHHQYNTMPVVNHVGPVALPKTALVKNDKIFAFLNNHAYTIVLIWFLIVCARSLQLVTGLHGLYHLRRKDIFKVDDFWESRVEELSNKLGIKQIVRIAESGMAKVPMVIGHLKPLILIPVGLLTALPPAEIDAILVHELAHIRRRDYLMNLLVSLMEIVFFFNPAVLWIASLIKTERENCCDDIAVAQTSSKVNYIRALVSCQEYQLSAPAYAMALNGHKNHLMDRVKRMVSNNNQSLNLMEKSLLAVCLLSAGLLTAAFSNADKIDKLVTVTTKTAVHITTSVTNSIRKEIAAKEPAPKEAVEKVDTVKETNIKICNTNEAGNHPALQVPNSNFITYLNKENNVLYPANMDGTALSPVQVNGKTLPGDQLAVNMPVINKIRQQHETQITAIDTITAITPIKEPISPVMAIMPITPIQPHEKLQLAEAQEVRIKAELSRLDANKQAKLAQLQMDALKSEAPVYDTGDYTQKSDAYKASVVNLKRNEEALRKQLSSELIQAGIIQKSSDLLSFKLSEKEFIVNGKKVPDDIYQKFRAKYVKLKKATDSWSWMYNYNTSTESHPQ